ncbi:hypothetical protein K435DRAFT_434392 [Dendrothele bispora CBS 962.96]|uniref:Uncharacterized protein n=1 Tax=Dendrothele bispora (strain CBS 962.96) TaxID=1314807 RepID=A0A4S8ME11_DENBC|nr:hypothetical protein K435DRAFT_434392 [Dendrothele bispora CBS 962.96]
MAFAFLRVLSHSHIIWDCLVAPSDPSQPPSYDVGNSSDKLAIADDCFNSDSCKPPFPLGLLRTSGKASRRVILPAYKRFERSVTNVETTGLVRNIHHSLFPSFFLQFFPWFFCSARRQGLAHTIQEPEWDRLLLELFRAFGRIPPKGLVFSIAQAFLHFQCRVVFCCS